MPPKRRVKTIEEIEAARILKYRARAFKQKQTNFITTTRFNESTWAENVAMRKRNPSVKCIYTSTRALSNSIPTDANVFVLEMNNPDNKLMGIGLIRNSPIIGKYTVYADDKYKHNDHVYIGKLYIAREDMTPQEMEILRLLEAICFKGVYHSKRNYGITQLPDVPVYLCVENDEINLFTVIAEMFKRRIGK